MCMHGVKISPSILAADLTQLDEEIARAVEGGCDDIHIDIMDGHFVPNLSFGPDMVAAVRQCTDLPLDVHLMVDNPLALLKPFADAGSTYLTVHVEITDDMPELISKIAGLGVRPGISFKPDTPVEDVIPFLDGVDIVLVMSVYPGFGGQAFIDDSYRRIKILADACSKHDKQPLISVDGGVTPDNTARLVQAGANHLVAGSAVFHNHQATKNIRHIREIVEKTNMPR